MSLTWSGSITLGPDQVGIAYAEVDIVTPSTVGFSLSVDQPAISLSFTWDGQDFSHSGDVPDSIIGIELLNMTMPGDDCCEIWVKYVTEVSITTTATWAITAGDGVLEHPSLTAA